MECSGNAPDPNADGDHDDANNDGWSDDEDDQEGAEENSGFDGVDASKLRKMQRLQALVDELVDKASPGSARCSTSRAARPSWWWARSCSSIELARAPTNQKQLPVPDQFPEQNAQIATRIKQVQVSRRFLYIFVCFLIGGHVCVCGSLWCTHTEQALPD